jgi:proline dehydrogenase
MSILDKLVVKTLPLVPKPVVRYFSKRYIAGEYLPQAVHAVRGLNQKGFMATMDVLGESVSQKDLAADMTGECKEVLSKIKQENLDSNLSIKLTQLGLDIDYDFTLSNVREIVEHARSLNNFVRIDMEDSSTTDRTLEIYKTLRKEYPNVGVALQSYLRKTEKDVIELVKEPSNFRMCKGIYVEPEKIAFKKREEINESFLRLIEIIFESGSYVGIATHDDELIAGSYRLIEKYNLKPDQYEFQMLLGVRHDLRDRILREGHRMRIYVPFGTYWYQYSVRRLKENPKMAGTIFKAILSRRNGK